MPEPLQASNQPKGKLRLSGVSRSFPTPRGTLVALENINLEVSEGEFLCIVGPSGCGKSTLLNLMAGLDQPTSGEIWMDGRRIKGPGTERLVIFQELGLFPWLTVQENVEFGLRMQGLPKQERRARSQQYLRLVHLSGFETSYVHQLSGGMKQRVALARSLVTEPDVLLMDEPFAALDAQTRDLLHEELARLWAETGKTIVFVTHNVREAVRLGGRVILLTFRPGRIKSQFIITLPRPRHLEDPELALTAREVLAQLKEEINKAVEAEYSHEENR
ncbi:MAG: ABC transporter ATP-binding protein [Acidobacteriia bacterium]|nr:ABC transporter ATP-binding protein [Terriglobia bacterium]